MKNEQLVMPLCYDVRGAAVALARSPWEIRNMIYRGELRVLTKGRGGKMFIPAADLEKYVNDNAKFIGTALTLGQKGG